MLHETAVSVYEVVFNPLAIRFFIDGTKPGLVLRYTS